MAIVNGYCSLAELKDRLGVTQTSGDTGMERTIEAASRFIDNHTGRFFYEVDADEYVNVDDPYSILLASDWSQITTVYSDGTQLAGSGAFELDPQSPPYSEIYAIGFTQFVGGRRKARIVGKKGYAQVPTDVKEACLLLATRLWKRKDAPFGVTGSAELGQLQTITRVDPDALQLLAPYKRMTFAGL